MVADIGKESGSPSLIEPEPRSHPLNDFISPIFRPVKLPCGSLVHNRLVKAATYEHLASFFGGPPNNKLRALYAQWSSGGWGMIITGNVQVVPDHLTLGRDMVLPRELSLKAIAPFRTLEQSMRGAEGGQEKRTLLVMQLSHAGRQSATILGGRALFRRASAPSPIPLGRKAGDGWFARLIHHALFPTPHELTIREIDEIIQRFVFGARVALDAGFDGIEVHAAHGYLIAEFLSPKSNARTDDYSIAIAPLHFLFRVVSAIREAVPSTFVVGVKISSDDFVGPASTPDKTEEEEAKSRAVFYVREVAEWGLLDFIEISGGNYENPKFMLSARQVFFAEFSRKVKAAIRDIPSPRRPLILLTGGLNSPRRLHDALARDHADLLGLARAATLVPHLPHRLAAVPPGPFLDRHNSMIPPGPEPELRRWSARILSALLHNLGILPLPKLIGAGISMTWYTAMLHRLAKGKPPDYSIGGLRALIFVWAAEVQVMVLTIVAVVVASTCVWICHVG